MKKELIALATGLRATQKIAEPASRGLKGILGFHLSLEAPKILRKVDGGFQKAGVIFHKSKFSSV